MRKACKPYAADLHRFGAAVQSNTVHPPRLRSLPTTGIATIAITGEVDPATPGFTLTWRASNGLPRTNNAHRMRAFLLASATTTFCQPTFPWAGAPIWRLLHRAGARSSLLTWPPGSAACANACRHVWCSSPSCSCSRWSFSVRIKDVDPEAFQMLAPVLRRQALWRCQGHGVLCRFLARLRRLVCARSDLLFVVLLFLLYLFVVRYVAGVGHGNFFRLSKPASFPKDRDPKVGQTHFSVRTRSLHCRHGMLASTASRIDRK